MTIDITVCAGDGCPRRRNCKRNRLYKQAQRTGEICSTMESPWRGIEDACEFYLAGRGKKNWPHVARKIAEEFK